ncbi:hypothetical protein DYB32_004809 [Aphanomyces invadans]|uniref:EGF-like domain-containing protein n=1 Tax=Aphanomyces invadans TaxID=157072 RepID=A0A418AWD2_9STRA|nr:hypothetical protein DYB32_004809 [Aphanomyces invadans]
MKYSVPSINSLRLHTVQAVDDVHVISAKAASDGTITWSNSLDSGATELVGANALDASGNLYIVGSTKGNVTADTCNAGSFDLFLTKLSATGTQQWIAQIGTPQHDEARHVLLQTESDGNEYVYVCGVTFGAMDEALHATNGYRQFGGRDVFVIKFTTGGRKLWSRQFGTSASDFTYGLSKSEDGSVVIAGGGGAGHTQVKFLAMFSPAGQLVNHVVDGGVSILPIQTRLAETPSPTIGRYTLVLNRKPTAPVTVAVSSPAIPSPSGEAIAQVLFAPAAVLFTPENWNLPQEVTVTAIDDSIAEDTHYGHVTHAVVSADSHFAPTTPFVLGKVVTFTVTDNDRATVQLSRSNLYTVEGGATDRYGVVLATRPWFDVTVTAVAMRPLQTQLVPSHVVFTPQNWNVVQWIVVRAVDDNVSENEFGGVHHGGSIVHYATSRDCFYNTRQPSCYYLATCDCAGIVTRGSCTSTSAACAAGTPLLVCDVDANATAPLGNGVSVVQLRGGNLTSPLQAIPVRYGHDALNPNPPTSVSTMVNSLSETIELPVRYVQFDPPPMDNGWGGTWSTQNVQSLDSRNPNPVSSNVPGLVLTAIPADVLAVTLSSPLLQVSEGSGATSQYTVVLHAPPSVSGASSAVSFCDASPNLNVCRTTLPPAFFTSAFPPGAGSDTVRAESIEMRRVDLALWQVSVVAQSSAQLRISPQFVQFTNANWFIPQSFTVSAVDDAVAQGTLNTSITHTIFGPASYANAAFWFKHEIPPTNLPDTFPLPLPHNAVPTVLQAPDHRRIQVVVADNDQAGVVVSKSLLSLKQSSGATNHVGDTVRGTCRNVLLLTDASKTLLKFHVPTLHLTAFQSSVSSASIVLFRTQYDVVNSSQLNSTTGSALYPTALLRVSLVASDWSESTFDTTSPLPPAMPFAAIEQNVTLSTDFTLTIDVTALLKSVSPLFVVSFLVDIVHDPANLQMHSRAHLENLPPVLVVETEYPNLLASRPVVQPSSSHVVATTDGSRTTSGDAIVSWWEGTLATTMPSGTLAIFLPLAVTTGYLDIVVATDPFDPTWDLATAQAQGTAFRRVPILRPVLLWPVKAAARCIRIYAPSIALAEVEFYGPGITITTTDDGWGLRSTTALLEPKLNDGLLRTSWEFASGAFVSDDNVAIGMPTTQSSVGTLSLSTAFENNPYLRVELTGRGILAVQDVEVRRWRAEMTRYVLLELRGTGQRPIALPAFTFMDSTTKLLPYRIHSMSSPQSFDVLQPWGASCFQAAAASYREWIVVDFSSVQQVQSIQMSFDTSACAGAVEPVSAFSISVYGDPKLARTVPPTASSTDPCACTSSILGVISAALPSSCANQCATFQCPTCVVNSYSNGMIGETLFASGFLDIALLVPPPSLPTQDIVLLPTGYRAILLRDQPLSYWRLQKANADSQLEVGHATFGTSSSWPLGFAVLNNANLVLTAPPPSRVQWFGQSYLNAGDSSFSIEFWVSFPSGAPATPLVLVSYAAPPPSASYEIGVFANQTTFFALTYGGVTTSLVGPAIGTAPNVWTHVVATYDWSSQVQTLASNGWNVVTNDLTTSDSVLVRRSDTISLLWTGTFTLASGSVPWRVAHVASYQRALTNYETLEHFYYSTPSKSYATYAINLSSQPSTPVDVDVVTEVQCYRWGLCNTSAIPPTLRFTAQNWNTPQHVIVHGTDDSLAQGLQLLANQHRAFCAPASSPSIQIVTPTYSEASRASVSKYFRDLLLNQATAASLNQTVDSLLSMEWAGQTTSTTWVPQASYADVTAPPVELKLQSMAVAGVVLSSPYLTVSEDGLHAVFEVALATEPKHDVHIHFNASTDCYRPCAVDDHLDEADVHFTVIKTTTVSQDPDYDRALLPNIRVAVEDNDVSQVVASRSSLSLTEARPADEENYTLVLTTEPWSEVNISVSNEAANECYRLCGYPLDMSSCGLPRALAANSIALGTSSSKELQTVTASMTTTNAIQRVMTSTTHVNPIFQLTMTGGYVLEVWTLQILFPSTAQYSSSAPFGTTFTLRLNSMVNAAPLDAFASASQVQAALNAAVASAVYSVALTVDSSSQQLVLSWRITYLAGGPVPALSVAVAPFPAVALVNRTTALQSPSGSIVVGYGNQKPLLGVAWNATADQVAAYLTSQTTVKDVMVSQSTGRGPNVTWAITFTSVPAFFPSLIVDASKLIGAPGAAAPIDVTWTCLQQANTVSGWFQLSYPVNTTFVASSAPLPYNATEVEVVQAMAAIPTVGQVQVRRRALSPELTFEWTIEFAGNVGQVANLTAKSLNLTGLGSTVVSAFVQQGAALSGSFQLQLGGRFKFMYPTTEIYDKVVSPQTTPSLPFNANASAVQAALLALPLGVALTGIEVTRSDARCDVFGRCREYTWAISFPNTPGDIPSIVGTSQLRGPGAALSVVTVANGTYLTGSFRVSLTLNESGRVHRGTTWPLPVNVTSDGVKEALEALPFVTSSRQEDSAFDPANPLVIPKATKGVRVSRQGPALDGGYMFGLRGYCVYPLVVMVSPDRYLCNATILTPRPKFDASNWYIPQEIHVAPVHDHLDETTPTSNTTQSMLMHFPYTLDMIYAGMAVPNVTVDVEDIDRAQVVVSRTLLTVSENGTLTDTYTLTLMTEPRANVLVVVYPWLDSQNTSCYRFGVCNVTLDTTNVTFTPQNWYLPQQVRMRATNDALDEADVHYSGISHAVFSSDPKYHRLAVPTIDVVIYDDDVSAFITSKSTVVVAELGRADEYTIVLSSEPFAKVTISPVSNGTDALGNVIVLPPPVVFTWRNWNIPQRMPVQAFHDWTVDPLPHTTLLSHTVATNDLIYAQKPVANVTVFTVDTNVAGVVLSHASVNGTEGDVVSYALRLSSKPWFPVNVTFNASQGCYQSVVGQKCNVTMATTSLQFTNATWDKWQFVAVAITLDNLHEAPVHTATISHTLSSRDPDYGVTVAAPSMTIRITDVDKSGVIVRTPSSKLTVAQGSFNASYSLALASEPYDNVTVFLSVPLEAFVPRGAFDNTSVVEEPLVYVASATNSSQVLRFIVFTPWDWNDYRSVVLSALTTGSPKPLSMQTTVSHRPLSRDGRYNASSSPVVVATVLGREDFPPPIPIRAAFDGTGVVVVISFDSPVFHAATMTVDKSKPIDQLTARYVLPSAFFSCDLVWNVTTSVGYLGDGAKCLWLDLQTLQITLGNRATLLPSHTLTLQSCAPTYFINGVCTSPFVVKARDFNVLYTTASIAVTVGPSVVKPNIVLVGAKFIGPCGDLTVDATASTGNANRPFRIKWFGILTSAIPSDVPLTNATALHAAATTFYSTLTPLCGSPYDSDEFTSMCKLASLAASATSLMWTVNRADLVSATSYVFGVELTNYFNEKSASTYTVQTLSDPVPVVSIAGATTLSIRRPNALLLSATTAPVVTNCSTVQSTSKVQFQWTVESPPTWTLVNTAVDPRSFSLAPNVLQAGTAYRFRVDAFYPSQPTLKSSDWATVTVTPSDLVAKLVDGDHVVGSADPLVVNASLSFDPDRIPIPLTFVWSCQDVTANVNLSLASMDAARPCINPQTSSVIAMSTVNSSVLVLPALSYAPAKVLNISVSVVQNCTVMLTASVESLYPYTTMWSQDQGDLVLSSRNSSVGSVTLSPFVFPLSTMQNAIAANTLTPGKTYIFRLTATDSNGAQGFGTVSITVNSPPTPGTLTISPPIGMAIQDQFTLRCENWSDEDQPLQYSFFKLDSSTRGWVPLSSPQSLPSTQTRLFLTNTSETNGTVQVIAVVTDAMGASTTVAASTVVVQPIVYDPAAFWTATSNGTFATSLNSGNLNDAMTVLMSTSALVSVKASCNATSCGENGRCNNVTAACDCVPGYTGSTCSMSTAVVTAMTSDMLSSLASVTTMMDPTPASLTQTIYTLSNIVALNDVSTMDAANVATAANMLKDTTSSMMAQEDPSTIVTSVGSTVLTAASSLLQSTKKDLTTTTASPSRRRLADSAWAGQPLTMSTIASNDPCLRDQNLKAGNVDASRPLVALTFGHSALTTGPRFTTACRLWNSATSSWDATSVCSKDTLRSTATSTTCVCDALMNIEVVVVSEEILSFVPEHPTLFRNENPSVVPVATLSVLLVAYAAGLVWGNRRDKADKEAVRLKRLGMLSKETWKELLLHESTKATATLRNSLGPQLDMYKQSTANAFMSTFHTTNSHDPKPANDSTALTAIAAESFALDQLADMALNEGALFGTLRLQAQHVLLRQALQVVNAFLIIVSVVFLAVGVDFIHFLGNTTHSVVLVLYGPTVGTFFLAFGLALAAVALLGILVAYRNTSSRLRGLYMFLMFVLLVGECVVLAIAYKHLVDLESFPQTTRAYLQTLWGGFSSTIRGDIQTQLGCCGFVATTDAPVLPCPEESIQDSAAPRTCFRVLTVAASALFENVLSSLGGVVMSQIVALAIANVLVRWESIRIENLSQGANPAMRCQGELPVHVGVKGDTSLFTIFLRCTLPVCCHLSGCSVVLGIAGGLDVLLEWDLFSLASASVFLKLEVGLPLVTLSGLYFLLHTMGGWALAGVHVRPMKWFAVGQVVLLVAGVCSSMALYTVASNLGSYANLQSMVEARYVALPTHSKLHLETALMCCGYSMQSQGTCTSSTLPLCAAPITAAVQQFCLTTLNRMLVFLTSQACLLLFTAVFLAHQNSHVDTMALTLDTTNEFTDSTSVVVTRLCTQVLVFASVVVLFSGCILVAVACDLLFATNLVTVSAALVAFSYHAGTYTLLLGLAVLTVGSLGIYAGLTRRKKWLWALAVVLCGVAISLLSLFAAAYRIEHPQTPTALNATLLSTWTDFAPSTKLFVQEAYSCCGFAEVVAAAGDVTFTLPYLEPTWDDANNLTNVVYTPHCPDEATEGCSVFMMETLTQTAAVVTRSSVALCALLAIVFLATGVLYYRQGKKKPVTWQVWILQVVMVVVASGVALTLLGLALVGVDVAAGTTVFTSSVIQTLFGHSLGALLVVCVTYACAVTSYGVYGSIQQILHVVFIYMVLTFGLVVLGWSSVAIVSSMTTSMSSWQPLLDSTLDSLWTDLSFDARMFVAVSRQCCGYNDPAPVGALYKYDRATSADGKTLACPRNLRIGCRSVLLHDSAILLGQLFQLLVAFSTLETVALITSAFLLRGLSVLHRDVWVGIVKKMRWWGAKYRDDIDRRHVTLSLWKTYDAKFTRPQRLTCILCAVTTLAFVDAAVQARFGCTRMSSMDCQPHSTAALLSLGFLYSIVSAVVQLAFVRLFVHIRHRHDDDDTAKIAERRRKEKVYFREVMQHSLHALMAKLGHLTMVTSEERFYSCLVVYMVLGKVGLGFYMFGLEVPSSVDFVAVPGLMLLSAVAVLMCTSFKRRKVHSRPCPPGPSSLQNVTATKVDGTIITKRITVVEDLEGCQGKMVAQVQTVAQIVLAVFIVMG